MKNYPNLLKPEQTHADKTEEKSQKISLEKNGRVKWKLEKNKLSTW